MSEANKKKSMRWDYLQNIPEANNQGLAGKILGGLLGPIGGSLLASALQAIFGIGSTIAANKFNSPRAQRNRLKKAGLPLAYMYQGKVLGQSDVPKLSIDPTLGVTQQRKLEQDQPLVDANVKMKGLEAEDLAKDIQVKDLIQQGSDRNNRYRKYAAEIDEKEAAAFLVQHKGRFQKLQADILQVLEGEGVPQETKRQELEKIKQQIINLTKQAGLMSQMKNIRQFEEWINTRLMDMDSLSDWQQFIVAYISKIFRPVNLQ